MADLKRLAPLTGKVQHYAWGGHDFIPALLGINNPERQPFAEYWLGAHPNAPSMIRLDGGEEEGLNSYLLHHPELMGGYAKKRFGGLPYLLKILDVKDMLSIQVHPSKTNAEKEFAAENKKGIDLLAPHRNYKDDNHKPEMMVALSPFWLLHGFKQETEMTAILQQVPELNFLVPVFELGGYRRLYQTVMEMPQAAVNHILQPLLNRIIPAYNDNEYPKSKEHFWAARAALSFNKNGMIDRGIFSIYFFNLVELQPGEAIFQDAGVPHAYLEGQNVELMANSDNVLRGGLTPKHIDTAELMKHVEFVATLPHIIHGGTNPYQPSLELFPQPAPEFELNRICVARRTVINLRSRSAQIFLVLKGLVEVKDSLGTELIRKQGEAFIAFDEAEFSLKAVEDSILFEAGVPMQSMGSL